MKKPFIERAIDHWLDGYSVIPLIPHSTKPYTGFDYRPFIKRQPTIHELYEWSQKYIGAGVGLVVDFVPDRQKTLEIIRGMDLDAIMDIPVLILFKLKDAIGK